MGRRGDGSGGPQKQEIRFITVRGSGVRGCSTMRALGVGVGGATPVSEQAEHRSQETSQTKNTNKG